jgi:arylsulfatase A-like enzyme
MHSALDTGLSRRQALKLGATLLLSGCYRPGEMMPRVEKPNIIVYLPDALRADRLGCYGNHAVTSPEIDGFSREGMLFERCYSQAAWTKPSIASLFSGFLPPVHQAVITDWDTKNVTSLRVQVLRDQFTTLAETLKAVGYTTASISVNPHTQKDFGFARGFDMYHYESKPPDSQMNDVLSWLETATEPFFLFVHARDPHGPYTPSDQDYQLLFRETPKSVLARLPDKDKELLESFRMRYQRNTGHVPLDELTPEGVSYLKNLYDAEIRGVDSQFRRMRQFLKRKRLTSRTLVAFISDHGEGFGEHGFFFHGNTLHGEDLHVPLILMGPGIPPGVRARTDAHDLGRGNPSGRNPSSIIAGRQWKPARPRKPSRFFVSRSLHSRDRTLGCMRGLRQQEGHVVRVLERVHGL